MGYWNNKKNIEEYIKMSEGYDGRKLIKILKKFLPEGSSVLELGMGSGKDLDILNETLLLLEQIFRVNLWKCIRKKMKMQMYSCWMLKIYLPGGDMIVYIPIKPFNI